MVAILEAAVENLKFQVIGPKPLRKEQKLDYSRNIGNVGQSNGRNAAMALSGVSSGEKHTPFREKCYECGEFAHRKSACSRIERSKGAQEKQSGMGSRDKKNAACFG